ncbi:MAG: hypothetical protein RR292_06760, partial [Christensenellaceae bacterium]
HASANRTRISENLFAAILRHAVLTRIFIIVSIQVSEKCRNKNLLANAMELFMHSKASVARSISRRMMVCRLRYYCFSLFKNPTTPATLIFSVLSASMCE